MKITREKGISILASMGLLMMGFIWGFAFVVVKNSLDYVSASYMLAFRFSIAGAGLAIVFHKRLKRLNKKIILHSAVLGVLLFLAYLFQTIGCDYTTAGKNAFLTTVYVILVPFFHWFISRRRPDGYCMVAAALALTGIGLLSLQGDMTVNIGDLLTLICGVFYALQMIYLDKYTEKEDPVVLATLQILFAAVFSCICAPIMDGGFPMEAFRVSVVVGMLYLGLLSTMVCFLMQSVCQKYTHPATAALLMSTESLFGALCSVIFLNEIMTGRMITGCCLLFIAITLAEVKPGKKKDTFGENLAKGY